MRLLQSIISEPYHLCSSSFLQVIQSFMKISEMEKKIQKLFLSFEITPFQLVALNTRFY